MHIEHVAIWTDELERLQAFYETYFMACSGDKCVNPDKQFESCFLEFASGARPELMRMPRIPETGNDAIKQFTGIIHIAFSAGSDDQVDSLTHRFGQDGYVVVDGHDAPETAITRASSWTLTGIGSRS